MAGGESLLSREIPQTEVDDQFPKIMTRAGFSGETEFEPLYHHLQKGPSVTLDGSSYLNPPELMTVQEGIDDFPRILAEYSQPEAMPATIVTPRYVGPSMLVRAHRASAEHIFDIQANLDRRVEEHERLSSYNVDFEDIPSEKDQRKRRGGKVRTAVAGLATSAVALIGLTPSVAGAEPSPVQADEYIEAEGPEQQPGNSITITGLPPDVTMSGNLTSVGNSYGYGAVHGESYQNTSVTNVTNLNQVSSNVFFNDTGPLGRVNVRTEVSPQHQIVDSSLYIPRNSGLNILTTPVRIIDTRNFRGIGTPVNEPTYRAWQELKINMGLENANKAAFVNLTVDDAPPGWFALYTCDEGFNGTSTVNTNGQGPIGETEAVKIDSQGNVCVIGNTDAGGILLDKYGVADWEINPASRLIDTRQFGGRIEANKPWTFEAGMANAVFIGRLTIDRASAAGWCGAYPTNKGFGGNSLVNPDGKFATSGMMFLPSDSQGNISIICDINADVIIDHAGLKPLTELGIDPSTVTSPQRLLDTRTPVPQTGEGLTLLEASGKFVPVNKTGLSCVWAQASPSEFYRYLRLDVLDQQPSGPNPVDGAAVGYHYVDFAYPVGDFKRQTSGSSNRADTNGDILSNYTTTWNSSKPSIAAASVFVGEVSLDLFENTPQGRTKVGSSKLGVDIDCPQYQ